MQEDVNHFSTVISGFQGDIRLQQGFVSLFFKSFEEMIVLFANYSEDSMPLSLTNVITNPDDLFQVLRQIQEEDIKINEKHEIVLTMKVFMLKKQYFLPLEKTNISNEERLIYENDKLRDKIRALELQLEKYGDKAIQNMKLQFQEELKLKETEKNTLQRLNTAFKEALEQIRHQNEKLIYERQKLFHENDNLSHENKGLKLDNESLKKDVDMLKHENIKIKEKSDKNSNKMYLRVKQKQQELEQKNKLISELEKQLKNYKSKQSNTESKLLREKALIDKQNQLLQQKEKNIQLQSRIKQFQDIQIVNQYLGKQLNNAEQKIKKLQCQLKQNTKNGKNKQNMYDQAQLIEKDEKIQEMTRIIYNYQLQIYQYQVQLQTKVYLLNQLKAKENINNELQGLTGLKNINLIIMAYLSEAFGMDAIFFLQQIIKLKNQANIQQILNNKQYKKIHDQMIDSPQNDLVLVAISVIRLSEIMFSHYKSDKLELFGVKTSIEKEKHVLLFTNIHKNCPLNPLNLWLKRLPQLNKIYDKF